jgi:hypothetical protein
VNVINTNKKHLADERFPTKPEQSKLTTNKNRTTKTPKPEQKK